MTLKETALYYGLTVAAFHAEYVAYLQSEGYDDSGRSYASLDAWMRRHGRFRHTGAKTAHVETPVNHR